MDKMGKKFGICKFCNKQKKLVDSHIIPRGLYWGLVDENGKPKPAQLVSPFEGEYQKRRPIGIYDQFLCKKHEDQFGRWDDYAISLFRDTEPMPAHDGWIYHNVNYDCLKLFFISILWRAHAADDSFFDIDLGPHGDRLKTHIVDRDPAIPDEYAVLLGRSEELYAKVVIAPRRQKIDGIDFIRFYFPGYVALIKVDQRSLPSSLKQYSLNKSGEWFVQRKRFEGTMEEKMIMQTAEKNLKRQHGATR